MKHLYTILIILLSIHVSYAQAELEGDWYVHYTSINGDLHYSSIPNSIEVTTINIGETINFDGSICNTSHGGNFEYVSSNTLKLLDFSTLTGFCNNPLEEVNFLNPYSDIFWSHVNENFTYTISGNDIEETLTLTNSLGDFVFYGRQPLEQPDITGGWFLHGLLDAENNYQENSYSPEFYIDFTTESNDPESAFIINGTMYCNTMNASYFLSGTYTIHIFYPISTLQDCSGSGAGFEDEYFEIFGPHDESGKSFEINLSGENNDTLTLTHADGEQLIYGKQPLNPDILGEWFLQNIVLDQNTTLQNTFNDNFSINFSTEPDTVFGGNQFSGIAICNDYLGSYLYANSYSIELRYFDATLALCNLESENNFEVAYFSVFSTNNSEENTTLGYNISGLENDAVLSLQNFENGSVANYQRQPLSVSEFNSNTIKLKNNPVNSTLEISGLSSSNLNYSIYAIDGKIVLEGTQDTTSINLQDLTSGLYFLKIDNKKVIKFIKK